MRSFFLHNGHPFRVAAHKHNTYLTRRIFSYIFQANILPEFAGCSIRTKANKKYIKCLVPTTAHVLCEFALYIYLSAMWQCNMFCKKKLKCNITCVLVYKRERGGNVTHHHIVIRSKNFCE